LSLGKLPTICTTQQYATRTPESSSPTQQQSIPQKLAPQPTNVRLIESGRVRKFQSPLLIPVEQLAARLENEVMNRKMGIDNQAKALASLPIPEVTNTPDQHIVSNPSAKAGQLTPTVTTIHHPTQIREGRFRADFVLVDFL